MTTPTHLTQSLEWYVKALNEVVKEYTSFEIASYVRVFSAQDLFNQDFYKEQKITYPFIAYQTKDTNLATDRLSSFVARNKGATLFNASLNNTKDTSIEYITDATKTRIKQAKLWPVYIDIALTFVTNTAQQYDEFLGAWFETFPQLSEYILFGSDVELPVVAIPSVENLSFPEKELDDKGEVFKGDFSVRILTYSGQINDVVGITQTATPNRPTQALDIKEVQDKKGNIISDAIKISPRKS